MKKNIKFFAVVLTIFCSNYSYAIDWTWVGGTSTNWDTKSNWTTTSGATRPQVGDDVYIYSGAPNDPTLNNSRTVANVYLYSGTITINTNNLTTTNFYQYGGTINTRTNNLNINGTHYIYGGDIQNAQNGSTGDVNVFNAEVNSSTHYTIITGTSSMRYNVSGNINFVNGVFYTSSNDRLRILNGATASGGSLASYVEGAGFQKLGTNAFTFPTGNSGIYAPISMSAPTSNSTFVAEYFPTAFSDLTSLGSGIDHVSSVEYWTLTRIGGTGSVQVTLYNLLSRSGPVNNMANLIVARYNAGTSQWVNHGNAGTTGTTTNGSVTSSVAISTFSPFTLASTTGLNPLPVHLISFNANLINSIVDIKWTVTNEINCDHYTIEKSIDGINWTEVSKVKALNSGAETESYFSSDIHVINGTQFYRLSQTDLDGSSKVLSTSVVNSQLDKAPVKIYPNPAASYVNLELNASDLNSAEINLFNNFGSVVKTIANATEFNTLDISELPAGIYTIVVNVNGVLSHHTLNIQ